MIHLLTGENTYEIERRLGELVAGFDGDVERVDGSELTLEGLPDLLAGVTLFSSRRLVVIKNASQDKTLWTALGGWLEKGVDNDLVLVEKNPDKRTKTYKWLEKHAEAFVAKELQPFEAVQWLLKLPPFQGLSLKQEAARFLTDYVGTDQWRLESELNKLMLTGKPVTKELIQEIVEPTPQATSFELLDAAFRGHTEEMNRLFETVSKDEDPYMFFGLVVGQIYALSLTKTGAGKRPDEIAKETGVHPFVVRKVSGMARDISGAELKILVTRLAELDANMKSRSVDPWTQVYSFLRSLG